MSNDTITWVRVVFVFEVYQYNFIKRLRKEGMMADTIFSEWEYKTMHGKLDYLSSSCVHFWGILIYNFIKWQRKKGKMPDTIFSEWKYKMRGN